MLFRSISTFNYIQSSTSKFTQCAVLVGYELGLSALLKKGADVWLNNPRITREASGTSGMAAAMNGAINFSAMDGWVPEFAVNLQNGFYLPVTDSKSSLEEQDAFDYKNLIEILEDKIVPMYYQQPEMWLNIIKKSMKDISPAFDSDRMANEYYEKLYHI